jgi:hypothetical protein
VLNPYKMLRSIGNLCSGEIYGHSTKCNESFAPGTWWTRKTSMSRSSSQCASAPTTPNSALLRFTAAESRARPLVLYCRFPISPRTITPMGFRVIRHFMPHPLRKFGAAPSGVRRGGVSRSIKLLPGIRLNFGKRGISTSIGVRGAHVTFGRTGTRTTVGLPGTGISYTHLDKPRREYTVAPATDYSQNPTVPQGSALRGLLWLGLRGDSRES